MGTTELSRTDPQQFWLAHVRAAAASGLSAKDYAAREGLSVHQLYEWRRKLRLREQPRARAETAFTPVQVLAPSAHPPVRIVFPNGLTLELGLEVPEGTLRQLLGCLGWPR
jgi:transposase-like protein